MFTHSNNPEIFSEMKTEGQATSAVENLKWYFSCDKRIDRVALELRANRKFAQKWSRLKNPSQIEENEPYAQKYQTTSWSQGQWSVINPPDRSIVLLKARAPKEPCFKITGNRDHYMSFYKSRDPHMSFQKPKSEIVIGAAATKTKIIPPKLTFPLTSSSCYGFEWPGRL